MNNLKRIHVNQFVIRHNKKYDNKLPACRVQEGSKSRYCMEVLIMGASHMIYSPDKPLPCGAKLWIETYADVVLLGERPYSEIAEQMKEITK